MTNEILIPIFTAVPATLIALAALIASIKNGNKINEQAAIVIAAAKAAESLTIATATAASVVLEAAAKAAKIKHDDENRD